MLSVISTRLSQEKDVGVQNINDLYSFILLIHKHLKKHNFITVAKEVEISPVTAYLIGLLLSRINAKYRHLLS